MTRSPYLFILATTLVALPWVGLAPVTAQTAGPPPFVVSDPSGDPAPLGALPATPVGMAWPQIDVTSLEVSHETVSTYRVTVVFVGRPEPVTTASEAASLVDLNCNIRWTFNDQDGVSYALVITSADPLEPPGGDPPRLLTSIWRETAGGERPDIDVFNDAASTIWVSDLPGLVVTVKKVFTPVPATAAPPSVGDRLTQLTGRCDTDVAGLKVADLVPDGGAPAEGSFAFADPGPGRVVSVVFHDELPDFAGDLPPGLTIPIMEHSIGVADGHVSVAPVRLSNEADVRQHVRLFARVLGADGALLDWNLTLAPDVFLDAGESRIVNLIIRPGGAMPLGSEGEIQVDALTDADDLGRAARRFVVAPVYTPQDSTLRFHSRHFPASGTAADAALDHVRGQWDVMMSLEGTVPGWDDAPIPVAALFPRSFGFDLPPLVTTTRLDPNGLFDVALVFSGASGPKIDVAFTLSDQDHGALFHYEGVVDAGETVMAQGIVASDGPLVLRAGAQLQGRLRFQQVAEGGAVGVDVMFDPAGSSLRLPVLADTESDRVVTDGRYLPGLYLESGEVREAALNPGKTRAFALKLANEGAESDDLTLGVTFGTPGWKSTFIPGMRFRVTPGNATPFGIELKAPTSYTENEPVAIVVEARSGYDPLAVARLTLSLRVTDGVEIPETFYTARLGALEPLPDEKKDTPAVGLPMALLALALLGAQVRRRPR